MLTLLKACEPKERHFWTFPALTQEAVQPRLYSEAFTWCANMMSHLN